MPLNRKLVLVYIFLLLAKCFPFMEELYTARKQKHVAVKKCHAS